MLLILLSDIENMKSSRLIFSVLSALFTGCASIPEKAWSPVVEPPYQYANYQTKEGPFVSIPFGIGAIVGSPLMLITTPAGLLCKAEGSVESEEGKDMGFLLLGPIVTGDIIGTPFLAVKKMLWDFPVWIFKKEDSEPLPHQNPNPAAKSPAGSSNAQGSASQP